MKLALAGTHSSGKTSLVYSLSKLDQFKEYTIFTEKTRYLRDKYKVKINEDSEIIPQFIFVGERAKEIYSGGNNFICDRSIYDVCSYTLGAKSINDWNKRSFVELMMSSMRFEYDAIIYVSPEGVEIEDNGLRATNPNYRNQIDFTICEMLKEWPPNKLIEVKGTTQERIETIKRALFF